MNKFQISPQNKMKRKGNEYIYCVCVCVLVKHELSEGKKSLLRRTYGVLSKVVECLLSCKELN